MPNRPIEMSGALVLRSDQNFYDQSPFREIIEVRSKGDEQATSALRRVITEVSKKGVDSPFVRSSLDLNLRARLILSYPDNSVRGEFPRKLKWVVSSMLDRSIERDRRKVLASHYLSVAKIVVSDLYPYPLWVEYVKTQLTQEDFLKDGTRRQDAEGPTYDTYLWWATRNLSRMASLGRQRILVGINEVFPQDLAQVKVADILRVGRQNLRTIHWRIREASEVVNEK